MGRPKIVAIDDSQTKAEEKKDRKQASEKKLDVRSESIDIENPTSNVQSQDPSSNLKHPTSKSKPGKAKPRSKNYKKILEESEIDKQKSYSLDNAVAIVKKLSYSKFTGTLEIHINTRLTGIRGLVTLPFVVGKKLKILAFGKGASDSGADIAGDDATIDEILKGKTDFDLLITTPEWMPKLAKAAKVLGPRGLMPSPKNGTITDDIKKAVESFQAGKTEYKSEPKAMLIHLPLGKLSQPDEELVANVKILLSTIGKSRIKKVSLSPTIGPSVKLDLNSI